MKAMNIFYQNIFVSFFLAIDYFFNIVGVLGYLFVLLLTHIKLR